MTMTAYIVKLYNWDSSVLTRSSLMLKLLITGYIALIWIYCIVGLIFDSKHNNKYVVIVEWNSVWGNLLWVLSFVYEWKHFKVALNKPNRTSI